MKNDGGLAFPRPIGSYKTGYNEVKYSDSQRGMTLRDYFAGQAIVGVLSHPSSDEHDDKELVIQAYSIADAMLMAREK